MIRRPSNLYPMIAYTVERWGLDEAPDFGLHDTLALGTEGYEKLRKKDDE